MQIQIFTDILAAQKLNNLIKRGKVLKTTNNAHNRSTTQKTMLAQKTLCHQLHQDCLSDWVKWNQLSVGVCEWLCLWHVCRYEQLWAVVGRSSLHGSTFHVCSARKERTYTPAISPANRHCQNTTTPHHNHFTALFRDHPAEPVPEDNFLWTLWY